MEELGADAIEVDGGGDLFDVDVAVELRIGGAEVCCEVDAFCILLVVFVTLSVVEELDSAIELCSVVASRVSRDDDVEVSEGRAAFSLVKGLEDDVVRMNFDDALGMIINDIFALKKATKYHN